MAAGGSQIVIPEFAQHQRDLIGMLNSREAMLQLEKSDQNAEHIVDFLVSWFVNHTTGEDRLFADFYHRQIEH